MQGGKWGKKRRSSLATLSPREEQRGKPRQGPGIALPTPRELAHSLAHLPLGRRRGTLPGHCHSECHPPSFCSSLPKVAVLCSKVGTRAAGTTHRTEGLLLGGHREEAWLKQEPLTGPSGSPQTVHTLTGTTQAPSKAGSESIDALVPRCCPGHTDGTRRPVALNSPARTMLVF